MATLSILPPFRRLLHSFSSRLRRHHGERDIHIHSVGDVLHIRDTGIYRIKHTYKLHVHDYLNRIIADVFILLKFEVIGSDLV
jgi:hypothetical protein